MVGFGLIMSNATFNNISAISRRSVVLVEETIENYWQPLSHKVVSSIPRPERCSNSQIQGKFEKILKAFLTLLIIFKKIPIIQVIKRYYLPSAMIEYRPILPLNIVLETISWRKDHDQQILYIFKSCMPIMYSWSAAKCNHRYLLSWPLP